MDKADATSIVKDIITTPKDEDSVEGEAIDKDVENLTKDLKDKESEVESTVLHDGNNPEHSAKDEVKASDAIYTPLKKIKAGDKSVALEIRDLQGNVVYVADSHDLTFENEKAVVTLKNSEGKYDDFVLDLNARNNYIYSEINKNQVVLDALPKQIEEFHSQLLPSEKAVIKTHIDLLRKQVAELNKLKDEKSTMRKIKNRVLKRQLDRIRDSITKINEELDRLNMEMGSQDEALQLKIALNVHTLGSQTASKAAYMPFDNGKYASVIKGHNYSGLELDNYAKSKDLEKATFTISHDTKGDQYGNTPTEILVNERYNKLLNANQGLSSREILEVIVSEMTDAEKIQLDLEVKRQLEELARQQRQEAAYLPEVLGFEDRVDALYDMLDISIMDKDAKTNPKGFEFWMHKPRVLLSSALAVANNQLTILTNNQQKQEYETLQRTRRSIIDAWAEDTKLEVKIKDRIPFEQRIVKVDSRPVSQIMKEGDSLYIVMNEKRLPKDLEQLTGYLEAGNVVILTKGKNGKTIPVIAKVPNFTDQDADNVIKMLQAKFASEKPVGYDEQYEITTTQNNKPVTIKGAFGAVFEVFVKWNSIGRLAETGRVDAEGKSTYRFEQSTNETGVFGIAYGKDGFISAIASSIKPYFMKSRGGMTLKLG
ncbi:MAG: hypothetical protein HGA35_04680 [Erysipelotrichaceae bacterium]|nr:hypothetical protein [Erysipelotrichaceae bacterium]